MSTADGNTWKGRRQAIEPRLVHLIAGLRHRQVVEAVGILLDYIDARADSLADEREQGMDEQAISKIQAAVADYHLALDQRQHGGTACNVLVNEVEAILSAPWVPGQELSRRSKGSS